jgi:hypothetical protein
MLIHYIAFFAIELYTVKPLSREHQIIIKGTPFEICRANKSHVAVMNKILSIKSEYTKQYC